MTALNYAEHLAQTFPYTPADGFLDYRQTVQGTVEALISQAPSQYRALKSVPVIVVGAADVDIFTCKAPDGNGAVVVVGARLLMLFQLMANLTTWLVDNHDRVGTPVVHDCGRMLAQFFAYLYAKRPIDRIPAPMLGGGIDRNVAFRVFIAELCFLISHEFAHIISGHLDSASTRTLSSEGSHRETMITTARLQEFEQDADAKGAELVYAADGGSPAYDAAPFLVLTVFGCLDHMMLLCEGVLLKKLEKSFRTAAMDDVGGMLETRRAHSTHPHGEVRYQHLIKSKGDSIGASGRQLAELQRSFLLHCMEHLSQEAFDIIDDASVKLSDFSVLPSAGFIANLEQLATAYGQSQKEAKKGWKWWR